MAAIRLTPEDKKRLIATHAECIATMHGVAGCAVVKATPPGDVTNISGGVLDDDLMRRVLIYLRGRAVPGKLVVVCTENEKSWRIARLSGVHGVAPTFVADTIFHNEQDIQHAIFEMRISELG